MVMIRFSPEWEEKLRSGEKTQTIRRMPSYQHLRVGDRIDCWITERREDMRWSIPVRRVATGIVVEIIEDVPFSELLCDEIAQQDGFQDPAEMCNWFYEQYGKQAVSSQKFRIIRWKPVETRREEVIE